MLRVENCYDCSKTVLALDEKTLSEDEMNNADSARKRTATSATTENKERPPEQRKLSLYPQEKLKSNACETTHCKCN